MLDTNLSEMVRAYEAGKMSVSATGGLGNNAVIIVGMIISALSGLIAVVVTWVGSRVTARTAETVVKIHDEVNSKTSAMMAKMESQAAKMEAQANLILDLTKALATSQEREQVAKVGTAVAAATAEQGAKAPTEEVSLLKQLVAAIEQYKTVAGTPVKEEVGLPALRTASK